MMEVRRVYLFLLIPLVMKFGVSKQHVTTDVNTTAVTTTTSDTTTTIASMMSDCVNQPPTGYLKVVTTSSLITETPSTASAIFVTTTTPTTVTEYTTPVTTAKQRTTAACSDSTSTPMTETTTPVNTTTVFTAMPMTESDTSATTASLMMTTSVTTTTPTTTATIFETTMIPLTTRNDSSVEHSANIIKPRTSTKSIIDSGSISRQVYNDFKDASVSLQLILIILGILTNACNITVFTQQRMRSTTSTILTFLSVSELGAAITELIMSSLTAALGSKTYTTHIFWTLFRWLRLYVTTVLQRCSFCFNIFVATERFIAVTFPLKAHEILRRRNPFVICIIITIITMAMHVYNPLKMEVRSINTGHGVIYGTKHSQLYTNDSKTFEIVSIVTKIIFVFIPLFGCLIMNVLMVVALWNYRKQRRLIQMNQDGLQSNASREIQTTITVLVSTFLFVLLSLPVTVNIFVENTNPEFGQYKKEHYLFGFITLLGGLLYLLSLSMDFFVYMILTRAFRQTFFRLCGSFRNVHRSRIPVSGISRIRSTLASGDFSAGTELTSN